MTDPWSLLGLEGPAGEADIRRAYARKLKTLDLEGDAAAFQNLVAARFQALELAARGAEDREPGSSVRAGEAAAGATAHAGEFTERFPAHYGSPDVPTEAPPYEDIGELSLRPSRPEALQATRPAEDPATTLADRLRRVSHGWQPADVDTWNGILRDLALLPIGGAKRLEPEVIRAVAAVMLRPEVLPPVAWFKQWRRVNRFRRPNRYTDLGFLGTVLEIASFYGWSSSDQAIEQTLDPPTAERLRVRLEAARRAQAALTAPRVDTGRGAISRHDVEAIFSEDDVTIVTVMHEAYLTAGRWPPLWRVGSLVLAPLAMILGHQKRLLVLWAAVFAIMPVSSRLLDYPYKQLLIATSLIELGCLHVWMAAYWYRGYVRHGTRLIAQADRLHIFHPELRRTFLSGRSPDQFGNPLSRWNWVERVWGWIRLIVAGHVWRWMCLILPRHVWSTIFFIVIAMMFFRTFGIFTKVLLSKTSADPPAQAIVERLRRDRIGRPADPAWELRARRAAPSDQP